MNLKHLLLFCVFVFSATYSFAEESMVDYITTEEFQTEIFNYKLHPREWQYEGSIPCIIDFYTTWCGPCKRLSPIMEELAIKYKGQVRFYKVDIERERELAALFGIHSIPTLLFCPMKGKPQIAQGLLPKETLESAIKTVLLN